uniref:ANK_REP_REGION domain-containing protein n=1 Tax=Macrostomum lignano TaxID=282301 RepID=A0A1I8G6T5_9PLAT
EEKCRQKILDMLLAHGANPNYQDDAGRTALSYACELRHNDVVRLLVRYNVDPELPDCDGNTPLMHCALVGNDTGIGILIKCFRRLGLDIDRSNKEGFTAMLLAARFGFTECASLLALDGHASVTRTDPKFGRNAEQWARAQGCTTPEVAAFSPDAGLSGLGGGGAGGGGAGGGTSSHRRRILLRGPCRDDPIAVYPSPARGSGSGAARGSLSASMPARALQQQAGKADQRLTASGGGGDTDSDSESSGSSDCSNRRRLPATLERDECSPPPSFGRRHRGGDSGGGQSAGTSMSTLDG